MVGARLSRVVLSCVVAAWLSAAKFEGRPLGRDKKRRGPLDKSDMAGQIGQGRQRPVRAMICWTESLKMLTRSQSRVVHLFSRTKLEVLVVICRVIWGRHGYVLVCRLGSL